MRQLKIKAIGTITDLQIYCHDPSLGLNHNTANEESKDTSPKPFSIHKYVNINKIEFKWGSGTNGQSSKSP